MAKVAGGKFYLLPKDQSVFALLELSSPNTHHVTTDQNRVDKRTSGYNLHDAATHTSSCTPDPFHIQCTCFFISNNHGNSDDPNFFPLSGWEDSNGVTSSSSHCISRQNSSNSLSSKNSTQFNSSRSTSSLKSKSSSIRSHASSTTVKSVVRGYIETEPIPYEFEHHDPNMLLLHIDQYRKVYTYPNMEQKGRTIESQLAFNGSSRNVYSTLLVRPKLFVLGSGQVNVLSRQFHKKQVHLATT